MEYGKCQGSGVKTAASPAVGAVVEGSNSVMASRWRWRGRGASHQDCMYAVGGTAQGYWPAANEMHLVVFDWSDYGMDLLTAVQAVLAEVHLPVVVPDTLLTMLRWMVPHEFCRCHRAAEQRCMYSLAADIRFEG